MSLVKFTELPTGSIQGGDVLAVAGASSYKVTAVEYANWSNKRIQGNTDKTIADAHAFAQSNADYIRVSINPKLAQIGINKAAIAAGEVHINNNVKNIATNKHGIATNKADISKVKALTVANKDDIATMSPFITDNANLAAANKRKIDAELLRQYENAPAVIASAIANDNYIKNPAAQHIALYWKEQSGIDVTSAMLSNLKAKNLEYPGWSFNGADNTITYNFNVAIDGALTIGQLGGTNGKDMEYKVNASGIWRKVGDTHGDTVKTIDIGYTGNAGAHVSLRVKADFGGLAFAIPTPAYWLSKAGHRGGGIDNGLVKLTHGLYRKRIDFVACGYWFAFAGNPNANGMMLPKPIGIGDLDSVAIYELEPNIPPRPVVPKWNHLGYKNALDVASSTLNVAFVFASTDPDRFDQAEVF